MNCLLSGMHPVSPADRFFSSLTHLEIRLASDTNTTTSPPPPLIPSSSSSSSLPDDSPLYLDPPNPFPTPSTIPPDSSIPPLDFLSNSPLTEEKPDTDDDDEEEEDYIGRLMELLGLSKGEQDSYGGERDNEESSCECSGSGGFYAKIAGVKGPRCGREMRRLDGWIEYYGKEGREPARLAHLLIGKAACLGVGGEDEVGFPVTVEEFLDHDPPIRR